MVKVFVSAGTPGDASQESFRDAVIAFVAAAGFEPRLLTDRDWDRLNPLRGVRRAMDECNGAIVVAYARYRFPSGIELRRGGSRQLQDVSFPTAWNQIEAAMAYERGLPLLVIAQSGLKEDAFLESTSDIRPFWTTLEADLSGTRGFFGYLNNWKRDVDEFAKAAASNSTSGPPRDITIKHLLSSLPWYEALALLVTLISLLAGVAAVAYRLGARR